jgi:methionyl-tRNA formyltransferase
MRIVFFGASALGYRCCEALLKMGENVVGLFTIPRDFHISYSPQAPVHNVLHRDFHALGDAHAIPVVSVDGRMSTYTDQLAALKPDLIVVVGWYYMIPSALRAVATLGCVAIHGSLLPRYRGGAPLVWAMIDGESEAGVTLFHVADGVDDGDIVGQIAFPIAPDDTITDLLGKAEDASVQLIARYIPLFRDSSAPRVPQDHARATVVPQRSPADGQIDWTWDAARIERFIRAQTKPYPGAFTVISGKRVHIWSADVRDDGGLSAVPPVAPVDTTGQPSGVTI